MYVPDLDAEEHDPRDFVEPPYVPCPRCKKKTYGIWYTGVSNYLRLCKECPMPDKNKGERPKIISLPLPKKKVIYLDQNIISSIAKAFDPSLQRTKMEQHVQQRWINIFHKLDRLRRMQLIVCPFSMFHRRESFVNESLYKPLKAVYKRLSNFLEFYETFDVQITQIIQYAKHYLDPRELSFIDDPQTIIVKGKINSWEQFSLKAVLSDYGWNTDHGNLMRKRNLESQKNFQVIYDRWKKGDMTIDERIEEESKGYGESIKKIYCLYLAKKTSEQTGFSPPTKIAEEMTEVWDEHPYIDLVHKVHDLFSGGSAISNPFVIRRAIDFLASDEVRRNVPSLRIETLLWASLARQASATRGRKEEFDSGDPNDIAVISNLLPYCDGIFVDKAWHGRLKDNPLATELKKYRAIVFSGQNIDEFIEYLNCIEMEAPKNILEKVEEVIDDIKDENPLDNIDLY